MISIVRFNGRYEAQLYRRGFTVLKNMNLFKDAILNKCWSPIVWRDGVALTGNFLSSDFLVLDFDTPGEETMEEVNQALQDHRRIIATTKSHQLPKNDITCDRFRLIIPFSETITDYKTYRATYLKALKRFPWADKSCLDGARFFFPSKEIVFLDRESEYTWDVVPYQEPEEVKYSAPVKGLIPNWCLEIINHGRILEGSRNMTVFRLACGLFEAGFSKSDVRRLVLRMKINFDGVNVEASLTSAEKSIVK